MKYCKIIACLAFLAITGSFVPAAAEPWKPLFNGKNLDDWTVLGGKADYKVVDGEIVGTTVVNTPNSFLCTKQFYSDFILEVEFKVDPTLNSGIQIRSNSFPEYQDGKVHGYQVEIDPSERAWSGGIFEEGARGWLVDLSKNPAAGKAFRQNEWNRFRIEAVGDTIKTWINGVPAAHLYDTLTHTGFIGLQVHSIGGDKSKEGLQVRFRNIRIIDQSPASYLMPMSLPVESMDNKLGSYEKNFKLLFDGQTSDGWRGASSDRFPEKGWVIEDGIFTVLPSGHDIMTVDRYSDFDLRLDFKIVPGANSGIKYFVDPDPVTGKGASIGLEYQIIDDQRHADAKLGNHEGSRQMGCLYDLIKADTNKFTNPVGQWNHVEIISKGNHVEHWLNGRKILEFERKTEPFRQLIQESKYQTLTGFGEWNQGHILLQGHGNAVSFKSIKIKAN